MTLDRRAVLSAAGLGAVTAITAACSSAKKKPSGAPDEVTYMTGFGAFGREGFAWVADAKGFFREGNIHCTIVNGAAGDVNLAALASGKVHFTEIDYTGALIRVGARTFQDFRMVASLNTNTLISIMTLAGRGIAGPRDLAGKTIGEATGSVIQRLFPAYAKLAGVDPASVKWAGFAPQNLPGLLAAKTVDAVGLFVAGAPSLAAAAKRPEGDVVILPYSNYMGDLYGNVLVTRAKLAESNPD